MSQRHSIIPRVSSWTGWSLSEILSGGAAAEEEGEGGSLANMAANYSSDSDHEMDTALLVGGSGSEKEKHGHKKISSWTNTSVIMCANLMGAGVLALPAVMKYVGWLPGLGLIVVLAFGAVYSGSLITRVWTLAEQRKFSAEKYGDLGRFAYGERGYNIVNGVTYFYISVVTVVFHLAAAESLQTVFYDVGGNYCLWQYSLGVLLLVLPLVQIRSLQNVSFLAIVGAVTILGTVLIAVARLLMAGPLEGAHTVVINTSGKNLRPKVNTLVMIVFSYCGQAIFTELISGMERPRDFPKAVWSSTMTMMASYVLIASVGYACLGDLAIAPVTDALPEDFWAQIANVLLFGHVMVAYVIEANVLTTITNGSLGLLRKRGGQRTSRWIWLATSSTIVILSFLLSNSVSFFSELLALAGATGGIATTYIFPCLFILKVDPRVSRGEAALCKVIIAISCVFSVVCLVNTVIDILQKWQDVGPPFMCMSCDYKKANHLTPGVC